MTDWFSANYPLASRADLRTDERNGVRRALLVGLAAILAYGVTAALLVGFAPPHDAYAVLALVGP